MRLEDAQALARSLMVQHGVSDWKFEFDRSVRRFGGCHWRTRTITLSKFLTEANDEQHVRNTILHEIAHALCPPKRTRGQGQRDIHGPEWQKTALAIGCTGKRCYGNEVNPADPAAHRRFTGTCPTCHRTFQAYRRRHIACGKCCKDGKYHPEHRIVWSD